MKKLLIFLGVFSTITCNAAIENINWYKDDQLYNKTTCQTGGDIELPDTPTKYGYTFQGWKFKNWTNVAYIESTGGQWIDTGYIPSYKTTKIEAEITPKSTGANRSLFSTGSYVTQDRFFLNASNGYYGIGIGSEYQGTNIGASQKTKIIFEPIDNDTYTVSLNDNRFSYNSTTYNNPTESILLSRYRADGVNSNNMFYYFKIYEQNILVHHFIPVLDSNGKPCMYDKITDQFFYNQGTGDFIAGPVVEN